MTNTLHAHVSTAASDCDGPMYHDLIMEMRDGERNDQFGDLCFKERVLGNHVSFYSEFGVSVKLSQYGFEMYEQTEEGYRSADVTWCEDESCDPRAYSQRDVFAEQMGY